MKIVKSVLILIFISFCSSCKVHLNDYYSGIIVDELGHPIERVAIKEYVLDNYSNKQPLETFTDSNGFFKINRSKVAVSIPKIIISKVGFISDSIPTLWHKNGETTVYSTLITKDSTKLVLRREKTDTKNLKNIEFDEDCVFDQTTQTDKFLHGIDELKNYQWNYKNRTAKLRLRNGDSLIIYRGGCTSFGVSVTMKIYNNSIDFSDWNKVNEKVLWISKTLDKEFNYKIIETELNAKKTTIEKNGKGESIYFLNEFLKMNNYSIYRELNNEFDLIELSYYIN